MEEETIPEVWVTKHALTQGIHKFRDAKKPSDKTYIYVTWNGHTVLFFPGEWHRTESEALARAEHHRTFKLASLKRALTKVTETKIKVTEANP